MDTNEKSTVGIVLQNSDPNVIRESLDFALGVSSFIEDLKIFFCGDAVRFLRKDLTFNITLTGERNFIKTFGLLDLYEIDNIYILQEDFEKYGCTKDNMNITYKLLESNAFWELFRSCDKNFIS